MQTGLRLPRKATQPGRIGGRCVLYQPSRAYFLRWRIRARMRRFLRPILRRPFPVFFVPTSKLQTDPVHVSRLVPPSVTNDRRAFSKVMIVKPISMVARGRELRQPSYILLQSWLDNQFRDMGPGR
jgi:hypothetical protein